MAGLSALTAGMTGAQATQMRVALLISAAYGLTSMTTSFTFKALLSTWNFEPKFFMLGLQMCMTMSVCLFLQSRPDLAALPGLEVPPRVDWAVATSGVGSGVLFVVNIAVGLVGLQLVNVPMFLAIRRTNAAFSLAAEWWVLGRVASAETGASVVLIVLGAVVAGWDSLNRDGVGYMWTVANNVLTALAVSYSKKFSDAHSLRGFGLPLYNALVALPLCVLLSGATGEFTFMAGYPSMGNRTFLSALLASSLLGVWTNYIHFLCGVHNGPLATSIVGNVKDILATVLGVVLPFGGTPFIPTGKAVLGLVISLVGAVLFSLAKLKEMRGSGGAAASAASTDAGVHHKLTPVAGSAPRLDVLDTERVGVGEEGEEASERAPLTHHTSLARERSPLSARTR